jgi:hypothetical protein
MAIAPDLTVLVDAGAGANDHALTNPRFRVYCGAGADKYTAPHPG